MLRLFIHYGIHFLVPVVIGLFFFLKEKKSWVIVILLGGIILDIDHLLASPVFDPERCSIGFHPLHSYWAMAIYITLLLPKKTRLFGLAFLIHILADLVDCYLIFLESK